MYLFYSWVWNNQIPFSQALPVGAGVILGNILLAYLLLKIYDEPVRKYLARKFLR